MPDITVLIADDEKVVRDALGDLIAASPGMTLVALAATAEDAIRVADSLHPDVAVVDVRMPGGGVAAAQGILERSPGTRILALSASGGPDTVLAMLQAGAVGYLVKETKPGDVIAGIREVAMGRAPLSTVVAGSVIERLKVHLDNERSQSDRARHVLEQLTIALTGDGFQMAYQPIFDLQNRQIVGLESLARFSLVPERPPNEWFAAAAEVGLGVDLELAAVARAVSALSHLPAGWFMAVNASPAAVLSGKLPALLAPEDPHRVVIELTEHAMVADYGSLRYALDQLRSIGVSVAVDDAGAGFASLRHILELAPELIKLDLSITEKIESDKGAMAMAVALTSFAGAIGARIVAEGIDSERQVAAVRALGIQLGQGYHLGKPGAIEDVIGSAAEALPETVPLA